jgi:hypothetical protein
VHNFFSLRGDDRIDPHSRAQYLCASRVDIGSRRRHQINGPCRKLHFIGISSTFRNRRSKSHTAQIFSRRDASACSASVARRRGRRRLHTKFSGVTVIFFLL